MPPANPPEPPRRGALLLADGAVRVARLAWAAAPRSVRTRIEDRFFYAIFQVTRVENDAYGWRPEDGKPPPGGPAGPDRAG